MSNETGLTDAEVLAVYLEWDNLLGVSHAELVRMGNAALLKKLAKAKPVSRWKVVHVPGGEPFMERTANGPWVLHSDIAGVMGAEAPSTLRELIDKLDGYLSSPEQIALRDEMLAALAHGALVPDGESGIGGREK